MRRALIVASMLLLVAISPERAAYADLVTWETGTLSGHVDNLTATATGSFYFDFGDPSGLGIDYGSFVTQEDPGSFSVTFTPGPTGTWDGNFSGGNGDIVFGTTSGDFSFSPSALILAGPISFSTFAPVPPLPSTLSNLAFGASTAVSNIAITPAGVIQSYDFTGTFTLQANFGLEVCAIATRSSRDQGSNSLGIQFMSSSDPSCQIDEIQVNVGSGQTLDQSNSPDCLASNDAWSGGGSSQVTIAFSNPLHPGDAWTRCVSDSLGEYWDSGQTIAATLSCDSASGSSGGEFDTFYDIETSQTIHVSEAVMGECPFDSDGDGVLDDSDNCRDTPNNSQSDRDGDGVGDACDRCPDSSDVGQEDRDQDGVGDDCEPECDDLVDNDADGKVDFPDDPECAGPEDDDESRDLCADLIEGAAKSFPGLIVELSREPRQLHAQFMPEAKQLARVKMAVARYLDCLRRPDRLDGELVDVELEKICRVGPIMSGLPEKCPPFECPRDEPGCGDPFAFRRARIPMEALRATALFAVGRITQSDFDQTLSALEKAGKLRVDPSPPDRISYLPRISSPAGAGIAVGMGVVGLLIGWLIGGRRRPEG